MIRSGFSLSRDPFNPRRAFRTVLSFTKTSSDPYDREGLSRVEKFHPSPFQAFSSHAEKLNFRFNALKGLNQMEP